MSTSTQTRLPDLRAPRLKVGFLPIMAALALALLGLPCGGIAQTRAVSPSPFWGATTPLPTPSTEVEQEVLTALLDLPRQLGLAAPLNQPVRFPASARTKDASVSLVLAAGSDASAIVTAGKSEIIASWIPGVISGVGAAQQVASAYLRGGFHEAGQEASFVLAEEVVVHATGVPLLRTVRAFWVVAASSVEDAEDALRDVRARLGGLSHLDPALVEIQRISDMILEIPDRAQAREYCRVLASLLLRHMEVVSYRNQVLTEVLSRGIGDALENAARQALVMPYSGTEVPPLPGFGQTWDGLVEGYVLGFLSEDDLLAEARELLRRRGLPVREGTRVGRWIPPSLRRAREDVNRYGSAEVETWLPGIWSGGDGRWMDRMTSSREDQVWNELLQVAERGGLGCEAAPFLSCYRPISTDPVQVSRLSDRFSEALLSPTTTTRRTISWNPMELEDLAAGLLSHRYSEAWVRSQLYRVFEGDWRAAQPVPGSVELPRSELIAFERRLESVLRDVRRSCRISVQDDIQPPRTAGGTRILLLLDVSGSMAGARIERARRAAVQALGSLAQGQQVSILTFGGNCQVRTLLDWTSDREEAIRIVENVRVAGNTPLAAALRAAESLIEEAPGIRTDVVLLSDGLETCEQGAEIEAARRLGVILGTVP